MSAAKVVHSLERSSSLPPSSQRPRTVDAPKTDATQRCSSEPPDPLAAPPSEPQLPPARWLDVYADDLVSLGRALAVRYRSRMESGLQRARGYFTETRPCTCTEERWRDLADNARAGALASCSRAAAFLSGVSVVLDWDIYVLLLDFELYTLELQRREKPAQACDGSGTSSTTSSSSESSSSDSGPSSGLSDVGFADWKDPTTLDSDIKNHLQEGVVDAANIGRCTGFAVATHADTAAFAQTVDLPGLIYGYGDYDCVLRLRTPAGKVLVYDTDGRLCPIGINSVGLGVAVFNLHQTHRSGFEQESITVQVLVWELLLGQYDLVGAKEFLHDLKLPMMCGAALLLVDASGATTVEFNPGAPPDFGVARQDVPVVRANHPLHESCVATYGAGAKGLRDSQGRQRLLASKLSGWEAEACKVPLGAAEAMNLLRSSRVSNSSTLARVACDVLRGELMVEFRERQLATQADAAILAAKADAEVTDVIEALLGGNVYRNAGRPRLVSGEPQWHFMRWARHAFSLDAPAEDGGSRVCPED